MNIKNFFQNLLITIGMLILSQIAVNLVSVAALFKWFAQYGLPMTLGMVLLLVANIALVVWLAKKMRLLSFNWSFLTNQNIGLIFAVFIGSRVIITLYALVQVWLTGSGTNNDAALTETFQQVPKLVTFLTIAVAAPIMEEIVFRGCIMGLLFKNYEKTGFIVSSLIFGLVHTLGDWISFPIYFFMGLSFAYIYHTTKRLEASMSVHFLNNLLGTLAIIFGLV